MISSLTTCDAHIKVFLAEYLVAVILCLENTVTFVGSVKRSLAHEVLYVQHTAQSLRLTAILLELFISCSSLLIPFFPSPFTKTVPLQTRLH